MRTAGLGDRWWLATMGVARSLTSPALLRQGCRVGRGLAPHPVLLLVAIHCQFY